MTWTYTDPSTYPRDELRLKIGDTDTNDQIFSDAEVTYFLAQNSNVTICAALAARAAAAKYARQVSYSIGELSEQLAQKVKHFTELAKDLESQIGRYSFTSTTPTVGTITDTGTMPASYRMGDVKEDDWSLNTDDLPDEVRGIEQ